MGNRRPFDLIQTPNWDSEGLHGCLRRLLPDHRQPAEPRPRSCRSSIPEIWNTKAVDLQIAPREDPSAPGQGYSRVEPSVRNTPIEDYGVDPERVRIHVIPLGPPRPRTRAPAEPIRRHGADPLRRVGSSRGKGSTCCWPLHLLCSPGIPSLELRIVGEDLGGHSFGKPYAETFRERPPTSIATAAGSWGKSATRLSTGVCQRGRLLCTVAIRVVRPDPDRGHDVLAALHRRTDRRHERDPPGRRRRLSWSGPTIIPSWPSGSRAWSSDPALRRRMGAAARSRYEEEFLQEIMVERLEQQYQQFAA